MVNAELRSLIESLQRERTAGVVLLAVRRSTPTPGPSDERAATDARPGRLPPRRRPGHPRRGDHRRQLRRRAASGSTSCPPIRDAGDRREGRRVDRARPLHRRHRRRCCGSTGPWRPRRSTRGWRRPSSALYELEVIREQVAFQHALIGAGIVRGGLVGPDLEALRNSARRLADSTTDFYAVAGAERRRAYDEQRERHRDRRAEQRRERRARDPPRHRHPVHRPGVERRLDADRGPDRRRRRRCSASSCATGRRPCRTRRATAPGSPR